MLGYGYPERDFHAAAEQGVDAIVVDSGSTDPGPSMLGLGDTLVTEESYARDLRPMLRAGHDHQVPLLIGSAGGAGTNAQVDAMVALIDRIASEEHIGLRVATVYAGIPPAWSGSGSRTARYSPTCAASCQPRPTWTPVRRSWRRWGPSRSRRSWPARSRSTWSSRAGRVTHAHPDHFNGILGLVQDKEVPVYATAGVGRVIEEIADAKRAQWSPVYGTESQAETYYQTRC